MGQRQYGYDIFLDFSADRLEGMRGGPPRNTPLPTGGLIEKSGMETCPITVWNNSATVTGTQ